jgi:gamma-F420-2:alpha-L-glutamate ligase
MLQKDERQRTRHEPYGVLRLLHGAAEHGIDLDVVTPGMFLSIAPPHGGCESSQAASAPPTSRDGTRQSLPDFILPRMGSATTYAALALLRAWEGAEIPLINSAAAIERSMDKYRTAEVLARQGIPVPLTVLVDVERPDRESLEATLPYPMVVKALTGSLGTDVHLATDRDGLEVLLARYRSYRRADCVLVQEHIGGGQRSDTRVFVIGGEVVGRMERVAAPASFASNCAQGGSPRPCPRNPELDDIAGAAAGALGLEVAGVDLVRDRRGWWVIEVNSAPGFKGMEACLGIDVPASIFGHVRRRLARSPTHAADALTSRGVDWTIRQ